MKINFLRKSLWSLLMTLALMAQGHAADWRLISKQSLAGATRWDYLSVDASSHRLFITHGDRVDVFDTQTHELTGVIPDTQGVHGVALAPALNRGYTSNGQTSTVTVFDLAHLQILGTLPTEKKPDAIVYDPWSHRVFVANGDSGTLTVIDALSTQVIATVPIGGKLEFAAVDGQGTLYVNVEDKNLVAVVDTVKLTVTARHDISSVCDAPTGLSFDATKKRLFVGCSNEKMITLDAASGAVLSSVPVGRGCDATAFDPVSQRAFASSGDGTLTVLNTNTYEVEQVVKTLPSARTLALDAQSHLLYLVAAEFAEPAVAGARPKLKPGSFQLLIVGP